MAIITCSKCGTPGSAQQLVCTKCGALLHDFTSNTVHVHAEPNRLRVHHQPQAGDKVASGTGHTVNLQIRGLTERLVFQPGSEVVLGRLDLNQTTTKHFDLTRFGAYERGVSREHAVLRFQNNQLTIIDLDSINGTTVNLNRLQPREAYVLSDGDEITLGRLSLVLRFDVAAEADQIDLDSTRPTIPFPLAAKRKEKDGLSKASPALVTRMLDEGRLPPGKTESAEGQGPAAMEKNAAGADKPADKNKLVHKRDDRQSADDAGHR